MEEKKLTYQDVPSGYPLCFNDECSKKVSCMHYQARLLLPEDHHHGENKLSPSQQQDILNILAKFGSTDGIRFDHYVEDWDFG